MYYNIIQREGKGMMSRRFVKIRCVSTAVLPALQRSPVQILWGRSFWHSKLYSTALRPYLSLWLTPGFYHTGRSGSRFYARASLLPSPSLLRRLPWSSEGSDLSLQTSGKICWQWNLMRLVVGWSREAAGLHPIQEDQSSELQLLAHIRSLLARTSCHNRTCSKSQTRALQLLCCPTPFCSSCR